MPEAALRLVEASLHYGGIAAVDRLSLEMPAGESLAVVGPNGAGKSSVVNLISGARRASAGTVHLFGQDITAASPDARARLGIGRTYQIPRPFARMSVRENVLLAARNAHSGAAASPHVRAALILERCGLIDVAERPAGMLPLLRRKRLELARALALRPRLLLLDEIGAGLIEHEKRALIALILELKREVDGIVLIEHVMDVVTACCERTAVLAGGRLLAVGATQTVLNDPAVLQAYLGKSTQVSGSNAPRTEAAPLAQASLLTLRKVSAHYGGVRALRDVDLTVRRGEVVALLGANGAGKTTLAHAVSGAVSLESGTIEFDGARIDGLPPEQIAARGVGHCMEGRRIFGSLTVEENLLLAAPGVAATERRRRVEAVYALFPQLAAYRRKSGTALSGGEQQMLAIGRALLGRPKLLIFDEISLGLAPIVIELLYAALIRIRAEGIAILLVEQDVKRSLGLADRAYVLSHGVVKLAGAAAELCESQALRTLYLGPTPATSGLT